MKLLRFRPRLVVALAVSTMVSAAYAQTYVSPADRDAASRSAYARGDSARASAALSEAVRLNPFDPVALNNLAVNYAATGDYQNAVALLERAQRLAPNRPDIVNNLANLKAWMAQDSQFATGTRTTAPQALNFPRAEDIPPELPPLWAGPQPSYPAANQALAQPANRPVSTPNYAPAPQTAQQPYPVQAYAQPGYGQSGYGQPQAAPPITYQQPPPPSQPMAPAPSPRAYSKAPGVAQSDYASRVTRQTMITERATGNTVKKRKRQQALDCPVP